MTLPTWTVKLAAACVLPVLVSMGVAVSAPSPVAGGRNPVSDARYTNGADGLDYAAITGPRAPTAANAVPACADPARRGNLRPC